MNKKKRVFIFLTVICTFLLVSCVKNSRSRDWMNIYEADFNIDLPNKYTCLFIESITSIDSQECYMVIKIEEDYKLVYENQFFTDYAKYETIDIFKKFQLAKYYFQNLITKDEERYFVNELVNYDWYGYEYTKISDGRVTVVRYVDLYVLHDKNDDILYIFYDKHQYPYNEQR